MTHNRPRPCGSIFTGVNERTTLTLTLAKVPTMERRPVDILRHETGHMVMAKVLGFETGKMIYKPAHAGADA